MASIPNSKRSSLSISTKMLPPPPYTDDDATSANLIISPYADSDASSQPASPASIESFDILDEVAWRRGLPQYRDGARRRSSRANDILSLTWRKNKAEILCLVIFFLFFFTAVITGGWFIIKRDREMRAHEACLRAGGTPERCGEKVYAVCVSMKGNGLCGV